MAMPRQLSNKPPTENELRVLWHLKLAGGATINLREMEDATQLAHSTMYACLASLEDKCLVIRTFGGKGNRSILKVELVDPHMPLPPMPKPIPLAVIMDRETVALDSVIESRKQATAVMPSIEAIIEALLQTNDELRATIETEKQRLQGQVDKLQDIVEAQAQELMKRPPSPRIEHLTHRVQDALGKDVWDRLTHPESNQ
jgi:DNA-binding transcriptional regulator GbsR (MarR family)